MLGGVVGYALDMLPPPVRAFVAKGESGRPVGLQRRGTRVRTLGI
jgi:hypothetical protein